MSERRTRLSDFLLVTSNGDLATDRYGSADEARRLLIATRY
jgi:hypothetical protein